MREDDVTKTADDLLDQLGLNDDNTDFYTDIELTPTKSNKDKLLTKIDNQRKALNNQMKKINNQKNAIDDQTDRIFNLQIAVGDYQSKVDSLKSDYEELQKIHNETLKSNQKYFSKLNKIEHIIYGDSDSKNMEFH